MRAPSLEHQAGFFPLAFGCESLFFGACTTSLTADQATLGRCLIGLACIAFGLAWARGTPRVQSLSLCLLVSTALLVGSLPI